MVAARSGPTIVLGRYEPCHHDVVNNHHKCRDFKTDGPRNEILAISVKEPDVVTTCKSEYQKWPLFIGTRYRVPALRGSERWTKGDQGITKPSFDPY